jgi:hypothetical protein
LQVQRQPIAGIENKSNIAHNQLFGSTNANQAELGCPVVNDERYLLGLTQRIKPSQTFSGVSIERVAYQTVGETVSV